jgi:ribonuclease BN (tRNA processing enzyme)
VAGPLDLLFLGTGDVFNNDRYWSSFLVNNRLLFDASPIVKPHLRRENVALEAIDVIFISHFHADHILGLPFLLFAYAHGTQRSRDLTIVGPPGIEERVHLVTDPSLPGMLSRDAGYRLLFREARDGVEDVVAGVKYIAREVVHVPHFPCFGYRVEIDGRTFAYSGDSTLCDALVDLAAGVEVFVLECSLWDDSDAGPHMRPDDIRALRRRLGSTPRFVLTHLGPGADDPGIENTTLATDFGRLSL